MAATTDLKVSDDELSRLRDKYPGLAHMDVSGAALVGNEEGPHFALP